jgi:hypothetical protein
MAVLGGDMARRFEFWCPFLFPESDDFLPPIELFLFFLGDPTPLKLDMLNLELGFSFSSLQLVPGSPPDPLPA